MDRRVEEMLRRLKSENRELRRALARQRLDAERLRHNALHDTLTSLPNRALLMDRLEHCVARAARDPTYRFAVLFLDIDDFKFINDSFGHEVGDAVLLETAQRLNQSLRTMDTVSRSDEGDSVGTPEGRSARLGGDEFVVVLDDVSRVEDVMTVAERLQQELAEPISLPGRELAITTSMGISVGEGQNLSVSELLREADAAMYRAKVAGKGRLALFDGGMQAAAARRARLQEALHQALERDELEVLYQPIVALRDAKVAGFEALLRWHRPDLGTVAPSEFIAIAEQCGEILPIQRWVLDQVIRQARLWNADLPEAHRVWASVNLSGRQLEEPRFAEEVLGMLEVRSLAPEHLKLEIKLGCLERRPEAASMLQGLRDRGVQVCVDDFGTEPLSLIELSRVPVDLVKIDREVASLAETNRDWSAVVQAMAGLARALHKRVVVVGIESSAQMEQVEHVGCDYAQGHFFARPLPASAVGKFIHSPPRWRLSA
jgi:predicted signal transduction protein with EAL and GGDEF domain